MSTLVVPPMPTSPRDDAIKLYKAFKGFGCDTSAEVNILAHRDAMHRSLIQQEYRVMYSEDLLKRLVSELSGKLERNMKRFNFRERVNAKSNSNRDAVVVKEALMPKTLNLQSATEVICSRTPSQIQVFKQIYFSRHGVYLEHEIEQQASGDHKTMLLAYVSTTRYEGPEFDRDLVQRDAKALYKAGEKKFGTDEITFICIFSERSSAHLAAVSAAYRHTYGSLKKAVKSETSGHFEHALLTILRCSENRPKYFAKVLYKAMRGMGTNDTTLIRVIVTRTEIDMQYIKAEYLKKYRKTLNDTVHSETSGHYRTFLISLLGSNH